MSPTDFLSFSVPIICGWTIGYSSRLLTHYIRTSNRTLISALWTSFYILFLSVTVATFILTILGHQP